MKATILGAGEWRPETKRSNSDWSKDQVAAWQARAGAQQASAARAGVDDDALAGLPDLGEADRLSAIGFTKDLEDPFLFAKERHVADDRTTGCEAGALAGREALRDAGVSASDIDLVLTWDAVPDRPGCPSAPKVAELVGATNANAIDLQQACASVISSIELAAAMIESGRARHVLLTQAHLCFRMFGFATPISVNVGDIATALVIGPSERTGVRSVRCHSDGRLQRGVIVARGKDDETDTPWWTPGGAFMLGTRDRSLAHLMMKDTVKMGALTIREACERGRINPKKLDVVCAPHPRGWIPGAIAQTLGLRDEQAPNTYETTAHVGGCGAVANLIEARRRGMLHDGSLVALYAQGQGMTRGAALVSWGAR